MSTSFAVGNKVNWTSQSQGSEKTKQGTIIAIVPAGRSVKTALKELYGEIPVSRIKVAEMTVTYLRILVEVPRKGRSVKADYYCPRESSLKLGWEEQHAVVAN